MHFVRGYFKRTPLRSVHQAILPVTGRSGVSRLRSVNGPTQGVLTVDKLKDQIKAIDQKIDVILAGEGALTAEQKAELDQLEAQRAGQEAKLAIAMRQEVRRQEQEKADVEAEAQAEKARVDAERKKRTTSNRLTQEDHPTPGVPTREASRAPAALIRNSGTPRHFRIGTDAERKEKAYRFGMFGLALISMHVGGQYRNRMAEEWLESHLAVHQSNNATGAHILIPEEFSSDLIDLREQYGVARRLLKMERMTSDTKVVPRRTSGLTAYFVGESQAGTESNKTWNDVRLTAKDLMVISRWSGQVDADSVINFGDDLAHEISYAFSLKEDQCAFIGTGASTYGGISGLVTQMGAAGIKTQTTSNTWSAITLADFNDTVGLLPQYADTPSAAWVCHKTFYHGVMQKLELAAGGVTALEISRGDRRPRPLFLGYPVEFAQVMPGATAVATIAALLGDYSLAGLFGDRQQEAIEFSKEATVGGESLFERNQLAIRGIQRFDINIHDAGTAAAAGPIVALKTGA
jgi:HK97 family phage major capsid protein